eukprot:TRINITY_DN9107_c0_g1_i2.p1 TRINITY_DN9107_c0_g1~~TRINITY_DN9107_c0_g1_i2.p1  ORF type:complete len:859 (+),score=95.18 TRINITY_DN9107_c0_g1_i2:254-2830(+)
MSTLCTNFPLPVFCGKAEKFYVWRRRFGAYAYAVTDGTVDVLHHADMQERAGDTDEQKTAKRMARRTLAHLLAVALPDECVPSEVEDGLLLWTQIKAKYAQYDTPRAACTEGRQRTSGKHCPRKVRRGAARNDGDGAHTQKDGDGARAQSSSGESARAHGSGDSTRTQGGGDSAHTQKDGEDAHTQRGDSASAQDGSDSARTHDGDSDGISAHRIDSTRTRGGSGDRTCMPGNGKGGGGDSLRTQSGRDDNNCTRTQRGDGSGKGGGNKARTHGGGCTRTQRGGDITCTQEGDSSERAQSGDSSARTQDSGGAAYTHTSGGDACMIDHAGDDNSLRTLQGGGGSTRARIEGDSISRTHEGDRDFARHTEETGNGGHAGAHASDGDAHTLGRGLADGDTDAHFHDDGGARTRTHGESGVDTSGEAHEQTRSGNDARAPARDDNGKHSRGGDDARADGDGSAHTHDGNAGVRTHGNTGSGHAWKTCSDGSTSAHTSDDTGMTRVVVAHADDSDGDQTRGDGSRAIQTWVHDDDSRDVPSHDKGGGTRTRTDDDMPGHDNDGGMRTCDDDGGPHTCNNDSGGFTYTYVRAHARGDSGVHDGDGSRAHNGNDPDIYAHAHMDSGGDDSRIHNGGNRDIHAHTHRRADGDDSRTHDGGDNGDTLGYSNVHRADITNHNASATEQELELDTDKQRGQCSSRQERKSERRRRIADQLKMLAVQRNRIEPNHIDVGYKQLLQNKGRSIAMTTKTGMVTRREETTTRQGCDDTVDYVRGPRRAIRIGQSAPSILNYSDPDWGGDPGGTTNTYSSMPHKAIARRSVVRTNRLTLYDIGTNYLTNTLTKPNIKIEDFKKHVRSMLVEMQ